MPICWAFKIKTATYLYMHTCKDDVTAWQGSVITVSLSEEAVACSEKVNEQKAFWLCSLRFDDSGVSTLHGSIYTTGTHYMTHIHTLTTMLVSIFIDSIFK